MGEYVVPLHISSFLVRWSSLKEFVPSWHFIHSVLATGVKCFHVDPRRSQEKLNKRIGSHIHSNIKAGRQTHAVLEVGGDSFPLLFPILDLILLSGAMVMLGGSSEKTGMKKRKTSRAYVLLRMGNNIHSWQPLPSPQPTLERAQPRIHVPPSPPTP